MARRLDKRWMSNSIAWFANCVGAISRGEPDRLKESQKRLMHYGFKVLIDKATKDSFERKVFKGVKMQKEESFDKGCEV